MSAAQASPAILQSALVSTQIAVNGPSHSSTNNTMRRSLQLAAFCLLLALTASPAFAQFGPRQPAFTSPEVSAERAVTLRIFAPNAEAVRLSGDLAGPGKEFVKNDEGVWELKLDDVAPGAYRYQFDVDGVMTIDPKSGAASESNQNTWSLVYVPGSDLFDTRDVPHGAVSEVTYRSTSLDRFRRMHVYTPPGYEKGEGEFPVLYLLHGAMDCDDSWSTVGRAGFILDNLIADGKAKPMIVVMPAGHTGAFSFGGGGGDSFTRQMEEFAKDFSADVRPYVEKNYRVKADPNSRAIAGLSMGGAQTLNVAFEAAAAGDFGYVGVYSSGVFGIAGGFGGGPPSTEWEDSHAAALDSPELKEKLKLVWFGCGKEDFLLDTAKATVAMLEKHGLKVVYRETDGGHAWPNWRDDLAEFAPQLFVD